MGSRQASHIDGSLSGDGGRRIVMNQAFGKVEHEFGRFCDLASVEDGRPQGKKRSLVRRVMPEVVLLKEVDLVEEAEVMAACESGLANLRSQMGVSPSQNNDVFPVRVIDEVKRPVEVPHGLQLDARASIVDEGSCSFLGEGLLQLWWCQHWYSGPTEVYGNQAPYVGYIQDRSTQTSQSQERVFNFVVGLAILPDKVLRKAKAEVYSWQSSGTTVMEMSYCWWRHESCRPSSRRRTLQLGLRVEEVEV
ncbi:hypothetical protein NE237_016982 [Protea cynaroides]|uniref:Uncharacterized protein n=1 Tax=Protea cynaroides TaxID=273540 RepID=A0A9Q0K763_9MAGN|nr:hypothetical protein NE237_016982 [Protea cynaroides]